MRTTKQRVRLASLDLLHASAKLDALSGADAMTNSREAELKEAEDAGYALLGRAFAKAVQEENAPERIRQSARTLDDWMFRNALRGGRSSSDPPPHGI